MNPSRSQRTLSADAPRETWSSVSADGAAEALPQPAVAVAPGSGPRAPAGEQLDLTVFRLGSERYGVESRYLLEVRPLHRASWTPVPCTPPFIVGIVNLHGRLYSLMDFARFLGQPDRPLPERTHLLRVHAADETAGRVMELCLLADDLPVLTSLPLAALAPPGDAVTPPTREYVRGVTHDLLIVLDLPKLLLDPRIVVEQE